MQNQGELPEQKSSKKQNRKTDGESADAFGGEFAFSPVATIGIDASGLISYTNDAALSGFNFDREAIKGVSFFDLFTDTSPDKSAETALRKSRPLKDKEFTTTACGEQKWVLISSGVLPDDKRPVETYLFIRDITRYRKRDNLFIYLNKAATALAKTRDTATALNQIAGFIVPAFANWFTVDVIKDGRLDLILLKHDDPAKIKWAYQYRKNYPADLNGETGAAIVVKTGKPGFIPLVTEQMIDLTVADPVQREEVKKIGLHSVIMAPMWTDGKITGLVNFISSHPGRHFDEEDLDFALNFANLISMSLENTRANDDARHELELRKEEEEKLEFLLDAIPHKMWTSAPNGSATYYNKQWYDYTGIDGFERLKERIWGFIHPDDLQEAVDRWPEAVKTGRDMEMEHRLMRHDGAYRWHLSRFTAFKNDRGEVTLWVGTSTDIHDQKTYELELASANEEIRASNEELSSANEELEVANEEQQATNEELVQVQENLQSTIKDLERSRHRFQTFLDSIPQIAWAGTETGEVEYYNQRWYDYTGLTFDETKAWGWKRVIHPDDLSYNLEQLSSIMREEKPGEFEVRERAADGTYRWHLIRMSPLIGASGKVEQWIGTATDIDELKKLQRQKDDFISIASHELKTPLTSLKTSIQLLHRMKDQPSPEKFPKLIDQANRSMHKLGTLVDELLNVNRIKETQLHLQKQWFTLSELVNACTNHIAVGGRHDIVIDGDKALQVYADESAIDQVIVNLVNNAVKYAPASKEIIITIEGDRTLVKLSVTDHGPGIPTDQLPFIFDRYYQAGKQNYRNPGLGLGLYISSEIIKRHGGDMGVESEVGKGSTFWFVLPVAP